MKFFRESAETRKAKMLKNAQDGLEQLDLSKWEHLRRPPSKRMKRAYKKVIKNPKEKKQEIKESSKNLMNCGVKQWMRLMKKDTID